jgi:hypothetical protein
MLNKNFLYPIFLTELILFYLFRSNSDGEMASNIFAGLIIWLMIFNALLIFMTLSDRIYLKARAVIDGLILINLLAFFVFTVAPLAFMILVRVL